VVASDGIWEFLTNDKVGEIVKSFWKEGEGLSHVKIEKAADLLIRVTNSSL
jgi:serine/threonine protein phosphatase PrpC